MTIATGAGLGIAPDAIEATEQACAQALAALDGAVPDLAVAFFTADHANAADAVAQIVHKELSPGALVGCSAQGVVSGDREIEDGPAVSVWAARLPSTSLMTFASEFDPETHAFPGFPEELPDGAVVVLLADPFTYPADHLLRALEIERPGVSIMGGLASAAMRPGDNRLLVDDEVRSSGAAGVVLHGGVRVQPLVSQGCRPVGEPATITRADRNVIIELGGRAPLERIRETFSAASDEERALMQHGLHIGRVIDEYKSDFRRGDFLIRSVTGADPNTGAIAVGDHVEVGETVQLHVRDAASADEDLRELLGTVGERPAGALLFTCNGRGTHMFPAPDHDARAIAHAFGGVPLAGFFAAGELGPIGGRNFLHGFTASVALFLDGT